VAGKIGHFRSDEARSRFYELYDRAVEELWPVPAEELDVDTRFGATHVRRSGAGEGYPLVLFPGNSGTSVGWYKIVKPLAEARQVLAVDVIGSLGRSVQTRPLDGTRDLAVWLRDLLDGLSVERAHLIGFSEGGLVAFHAARGNDERLASMVAIDAGGTVERIKLRFWASLVWIILRMAVRGSAAMREYGQRLIPGVELSDLHWDLMTTGAKGFRQGLPLPKKVPDDHLRHLVVPTLLYMAGDSEVYDASRAATRARALMPDVEIVIVEGAQHGLPLTRPDRTWADILQFVSRHDPRAEAT
jgi:pimeloyl-ACP methyl ester carboxylesterase